MSQPKEEKYVLFKCQPPLPYPSAPNSVKRLDEKSNICCPNTITALFLISKNYKYFFFFLVVLIFCEPIYLPLIFPAFDFLFCKIVNSVDVPKAKKINKKKRKR